MNLFRLSTLALAISLAACGSDGSDGSDGKDGVDGIDGTNGVNGVDGQDGTDGVDGQDGTDGVDGQDGTDGQDGQDGADASTAKAIDLTILHMNDHHSHIAADTFDFDVSGLTLDTSLTDGSDIAEVEVTYGGFPMMVTLFDTLASQSDNVLKLHAGDAVTGTLYYSLFNGLADAEMMNQVCFDAFALGNHEFDNGDDGLAVFIDALNASACETPTLAANVVPHDDSAIKDKIQPYQIFERDGEQIGVIGIDIANKTKNSSFPDDGTEFLDETTTAQQYIDELEGMGVNKIVLMTHYQYNNDLTLAAALTGVDVIVGGDSHTLLGDDTFASVGVGSSVAEYPTVVTNADGETVCVVQAWEYAHLLGKLTVSFDADGVVSACEGQPYMPIANSYQYEDSTGEDATLSGNSAFAISQALTAHDEIVLTQEDSVTADLLAVYDEQTSILEQTVIGTIAEDMCFERIPGQGRSSICDVTATSAHGSDITGQVAKGFVTVTPTADIGIQNGGGVRDDLAAGDATIADAFTLMPFANTLVTLDMTGQQIQDVLEDALDYTLDTDGSTGAYPYAYGLRFDVDLTQEKGSRFSNIEVNSRGAGDWSSMDLATTYTVVTNNYIAAGQDGYTTFGTITGDAYVDTFTEYAQSFVDYMTLLTDNGESLGKLPVTEYSTQTLIDTNGCNHSTETCTGY
jgi:5'-nucleotidase